jgi:serine/threonine-protein kinase
MTELSRELWQRLGPLLDEALDLPAAERGSWLQTLSRQSPELGRELGALLDEQDEVDRTGFLDRLEEVSLAGLELGPYRLERPLGEGGMGVVWLARRCDGRFEGSVAIKLLHLAAINRMGLARFQREGSVLARLTHPSIARLLDAGVSGLGQPYLILELVDGQPIDGFAKARHLGRRERIDLMLQVLAAVEHAHSLLIIHRDLKPSNILVTRDGGVKLLDFGIAKLLDEPERNITLSVEGRAFTPLYAAPEQLRGEPLTTATDVYAAGVLLYSLLAGRHPTSEGVSTPAECVRSVLETEPRALGLGDLDSILAKALSKAPAERYASATAFADDLKRYLAGAPVAARPDSRAYRLEKFLRRHWGRVGLALAVSLALIAAAAVSIGQARAARAQQELAEREAKREKLTRQFLMDLFASNSDQQRDPILARQLTARQLLDVGAEKAVRQLEDDPELQAETLNHLADMYAQLKLGEQAGQLRRQAIDALERVNGPRHPKVAEALLSFADDVAYTNQRAMAREALGEALATLDYLGDDSSEARGASWIVAARLARYDDLKAMLHAAEEARRHFRLHPPESYWSAPFVALELAGIAQQLSGHYAEAEALARQSLADIEGRVEHSAAWRINPLVHIGEAMYARADFDPAIATLSEALALSKRINGDSNGQTLQTQAKLAGFSYAAGRRAEGLALLEATRVELERGPPTDRAGAWSSLRQFLALAMLREGRLEEAEGLWASEVDERRRYYPDSMPLARALVQQATVAVALGRDEAAEAALDEGCRLWQERSGGLALPALANDCWLARAQLALARDRAEDAVQWLARVAPLPEPVPLQLDQTQAAVEMARALLLQGDGQGALRAASAALAMLDASPLRGRQPQLEARARLGLGQALEQVGSHTAALRELDAAVVTFAANGDANSPWLAQAKAALARCLLESAAPEPRERARVLLEEAQTARRAHPRLAEHLLRP